MGNRALRKKVGEALKAAGYSSKLYHGRKYPKKVLGAEDLRHILYMLSFKPGDIVNDCDGFNHKVTGHKIYYMRWTGNLSILCVDRLTFEDGGWSCGCPSGPEPAYTREQVEQYFHDMTPEYIEHQKHLGWWSEYSQKMYDAIKRGDHICDENGIILPEYKIKYGSQD